MQFNSGGGGIFAAEWDPVAGHIRTWFWPSTSVPADLLNGYPEPDSWGTPYSFFSLNAQSCSASHFVNMRLVFSLTFCGDLGGPKFAEMCPEWAQTMTCEEFVALHPEQFTEAYWSIRSLKVYQKGFNPAPTHGGSTMTFLSAVHGNGPFTFQNPTRALSVAATFALTLLLAGFVMLARAGLMRALSVDGGGLLNINGLAGNAEAIRTAVQSLFGPTRPNFLALEADPHAAWDRPVAVQTAVHTLDRRPSRSRDSDAGSPHPLLSMVA